MPQAPVQVKALDDIPGFAPQTVVPQMKISPLTAPMPGPQEVDATQLTPAWDVNDAVSALNNIRATQTEAAKAATDALNKNTLIQQRVYDENVQAQDSVLDSYEKLQRIERNPIADLFALFDPKTWSKQHQLLEIEKAQLKANQSTMRGQALININNQLPALRQAEVQAAQQGFQYTKDVFGIVKDVSELTLKQWDMRLKATDLRLKLSAEERTIRDDALKAMTVQQARQQLKLAEKGQGDWAGLEGLLEDKIDRDERQQLDIAQIKQNMENQRFDLAEKQTNSLIAGIDFAEGQRLVEQALASNSSTVNYKGIPIPLGKLITGVEQTRKDTEALEATSLARSNFGINQQLQKLVTQNSALATTNPEAANTLQAISQFATQTDRTNPYQLQRFKSFLDAMQVQTDNNLKQLQANYTTPQAKAAIEDFAKTGIPNPLSAHSVVEDALAQPGIAATGKLAPVWSELRKQYADRVQQLNPANMPAFNTSSNQGIQQMMLYLARNPTKNLPDIRAETVQGLQGSDQINDAVNGIFHLDTTKAVLDTLSTAPGPGASVYLNLVRDPRKIVDAEGHVDPTKIARYLAQQTVLNGQRADYLQTFIEALRTHNTQASSVTADPGLTVEDQHLLTTLYGPNAIGSINQAYLSFMTQEAEIQRRNVEEGIRQDITGQTQRRALSSIVSGDPDFGLDPKTRDALIRQVPSATGLDVTADEIKAIYGTDPRFGSLIPQAGR